jgi:hypothetical protein
MRLPSQIAIGAVLLLGAATASGSAYAQAELSFDRAICAKFHLDDKESKPLKPVKQLSDGDCHVKTLSNGIQLPDPKCTPGAINTTVTQTVLRTPGFTTKCLRDDVTSEEKKKTTYGFYGIKEPPDNEHANQTCELDHLISLELGGGDGLENIWPQCGPKGVALDDRFFKRKDKVENFLAEIVKTGKMDLKAAQEGISTDWTKFLKDAEEACKSEKCKVD